MPPASRRSAVRPLEFAGAIGRRQACLQLAAAALAAPGALAVAATPAARATKSATPAAAVAASAGQGEGTRWLPWPGGRSQPPLELPEVDGANWSLAQQAGRPVLLNFWASWCAPCLAEMPALVALQQQFQPRGLLVVAVNFREGADTVRRLRAAHGSALVWLRDSYGEAALAWGVRSFPSSVLIDHTGLARLRVQGEADWADPALQQRLAALL